MDVVKITHAVMDLGVALFVTIVKIAPQDRLRMLIAVLKLSIVIVHRGIFQTLLSTHRLNVSRGSHAPFHQHGDTYKL
jgi:hypothetical protein